MEFVALTVEVPEPLAARLTAEAACRGVDPVDLAVETLNGAMNQPAASEAEDADALDAFIGCGSSGRPEPFDIHAARAARVPDVMSYEHFALVCGHPETLTVPRPDDSLSLSDAVEEVFLSSTNLLVLEWDGVSVPLSFKYDVSWILLDAIEMIEQMLSASGPVIVTAHFPSNTFQVVWEISALANGGIEINATWNAVAGHVASLLADRSPLRTDASAFVSEWRHLFAVVVRAINEAQMPVEMVEDYDRLLRLSHSEQAGLGTSKVFGDVKE